MESNYIIIVNATGITIWARTCDLKKAKEKFKEFEETGEEELSLIEMLDDFTSKIIIRSNCNYPKQLSEAITKGTRNFYAGKGCCNLWAPLL